MPKILIIEDNRENLELMRFLLEASGHGTLTARTGDEGLECVIRDAPDLIVCDIQMPLLDGFGVVRQLRTLEGRKETPCVAVTALAMPGDRTRALAGGFDGYISKPIDPESFVAELERHLGPRPASAMAPPARSGEP
jgi:two-component system cell cycle response regulator